VQAPSSQWHGAQGRDWQGKSWLAAPKKAAHPPDTCFLPKRWVHTWGADGSGHTKGVNCIRFFPKTGHLLMSAGLDSKVKVRTPVGAVAAWREPLVMECRAANACSLLSVLTCACRGLGVSTSGRGGSTRLESAVESLGSTTGASAAPSVVCPCIRQLLLSRDEPGAISGEA
jgi:hypothetical protein